MCIRLSSGYTRTDSTTFTEEELLDAGYILAEVSPSFNEKTKKVVWESSAWNIVDKTAEELNTEIQNNWAAIRNKRIELINSIEWRIQRCLSRERLLLPQIDDLHALDQYLQDLRDITTQTDVFNIEWPTLNTFTI